MREQTEQNCRLLKSEAFLSQLQAVIDSREGQRIDEAAKRLTPQALREAGVQLPKGLRVSSRYFEPELKRPLELGDVYERVNLVGTLAELSPGILSKLREQEPDLLDNLTERLEPRRPGDIGPLAACGGIGVSVPAGGVCACFGS